MNPVRAILLGFRNYANFEGRATRSEYWWFYGFFVVLLVGIFVASLTWSPTLLSVWVAYMVAMAPPLFSVTVRRLHDIDRSGRLALMGFLPFAGGPRLTRLLSRPGTVGPNRYGPDPLRPGLGGGWIQRPVGPDAQEHPTASGRGTSGRDGLPAMRSGTAAGRCLLRQLRGRTVMADFRFGTGHNWFRERHCPAGRGR